ncbi:MAG: PEP-utilizing enzyme [archaeon]
MEWIELTRKGKPLPILLIDAAAMGFNNHFSEFHDKKTRITNFRQAFGARWMPKKDWNNYVRVYRANEDKIIFWMDLWLKQFLELKRFTEKVNKMNLTNKSSNQLKQLFKKYFELNSKACSFAYDYRAVGEVYPEKINSFLKEKAKDSKELNECIKTIFSLDKPIEMHREKMNLLKIAIKSKRVMLKGKGIENALENHSKRFGFLGTYIFYGEPIEAKDFKKKLKNLAKKPLSKLEKDRLKEKNRFKENKKETKEIIKKFRLSKSEARKIRDIKVSLHTSMICDEYYTYTSFKIRPLLFEIGKRFSLSYNQLIEMRNEEILSLFERKLNKRELNEINSRFKDAAIILEKGKTKVITGKELELYSKPYLAEMKKIKGLNEIKGETAFPGKVKGRVNIIGRVTDLPSFRKGNILVTGSTLPQYVPAMKKALAIITDEGGMLSHAAIMSREFKKPCIIGTKIATRVLRNGDFIEVNASGGIVRRINK